MFFCLEFSKLVNLGFKIMLKHIFIEIAGIVVLLVLYAKYVSEYFCCCYGSFKI